MIPKKIHYFWVSDKPMPDGLRECLKSWKKFMPDYELVEWNADKIKHIDNPFLRDAISVGKWAFAADYVRVYALYNEGGIYLDTDVEVLKSFDDLLCNKAFIGAENHCHVSRFYTPTCLTSYTMGTEPGHPYFKLALDYYNGRRFIRSDETWLPEELRYDIMVNSYILMKIAKMFGYNESYKASFPQYLKDGLVVLPPQYFTPVYPDEETYSIHWADGSWRDKKVSGKASDKSLASKIKKKVRHKFLSFFGKRGFIILKKK